MRAREDIDITGGDVGAKNALVLEAQRDLKLSSTTAEHRWAGAGAAACGAAAPERRGGQLIARAGRDIHLAAGAVRAGTVGMHAGRDLRLDTLQTRDALDATRDEKNFGRVQRSAEQGTAIQADELLLTAGRDVNTRAAQVQAEQDLTVQAGRDVNISAGEASYQVEHGLYAKSSGVYDKVGNLLSSFELMCNAIYSDIQTAQGSGQSFLDGLRSIEAGEIDYIEADGNAWIAYITRDKVWFEGLYSQGEGGEVSFAQYKRAVETYVSFLADPEHKPIEVEFPAE